MRKGRGGETDFKCKLTKQLNISGPAKFLFLLVLHAICVSVEEEQWAEGTWEAEQRVTLVRKTKEDAQQIWSGEEEGKGPNKAQKNAATGECPFLFLQHPPCCYNSLHENSYYAVCLGHDSERVPLSRGFISGFLVQHGGFILNVNTWALSGWWLCVITMHSEISQPHPRLLF